MKITFRFENGSSEIILTPSDARDKQYLDLCIDGRPEIKLKPSKEDGIFICFMAKEDVPKEEKPKSIMPVDEYMLKHACKSEPNG